MTINGQVNNNRNAFITKLKPIKAMVSDNTNNSEIKIKTDQTFLLYFFDELESLIKIYITRIIIILA